MTRIQGGGSRRRLLGGVLLLVGWLVSGAAAGLDFTLQPGREVGRALQALEGSKVRIAYQYGLGYLPLMIMRQNKLIEKHTAAMGLGAMEVRWNRYPSGAAMNAALRAGLLDFASGGVAPMVTAWSRTRDSSQVRGVASLGTLPLVLVANRAAIRSVADFSDADRIAVPDSKGSTQAVLLRLAAARAFGVENARRLDPLMVSMAHPQAERALLGRPPTISAHFSGPPYQNQELASKVTHKVTDSYDLLQGPASHAMVWTSNVYRKSNPKTLQAVYQAVQEAMAIINDDPDYAARVYLQQSNAPQSVPFIRRIITAPQVDYTVVPRNTMGYAEFMAVSGMIEVRPSDWQVMFFNHLYGEPGS